ncbi:MAG: oligosaccharyl transferase subunit ost3/OST6 [Piccolia ochrophora]|nr:MAG: oligosaccharyl transferase subunit ost3/OST6 [Piccolia ochrophora]
MRLLRPLTVALLPLTSLAARKPSGDRFDDFHTQSLSSAPLKLTDALYDDLIAPPRDYSVILLFTALETRFGCQLCRDTQPEWELMSRSWVKGDRAGDSRVIFSTIDFTDGKNTFQKFMLQTAPVMMYFPPTSGAHAKLDAQPIRLDFGNGPKSAEDINAWISRQLPEGPRPRVVRPVNYIRIVAVTTIVLGLITLFAVASPYILPVIQNRNVWAAFSLISILLFTSGHMFNHIRKVPYVSGDGKGGISYFAGGFTTQFGLETQIVAAIYGVLSFTAIALAVKVPRIADPKQQQVAVWVGGAVMLAMYSFLLGTFRTKNSGYPFFLPPF